MRFHTQLNILHRKDRFTAFDPHTTPYFAQNFNSLIHTQKRTGPKFALVCGQYIGISAFHGICLRKFQNNKKVFGKVYYETGYETSQGYSGIKRIEKILKPQ